MSETFYNLAFSVLSLLILGGALGVLFFKNLLHSAVSLFFCLAGMSGLYILLSADFLAVAQLLIYAGGILVLMIFGIFLTANIYGKTHEFKERKSFWLVGLGVGFVLFSLLAAIISKTPWALQTVKHESSVEHLGNLLLSKYILPFELISVVLLFAMVGSVLLVKKEMEDTES